MLIHVKKHFSADIKYPCCNNSQPEKGPERERERDRECERERERERERMKEIDR